MRVTPVPDILNFQILKLVMNYEDDIEDLSTLASSEQYLGYFKSLKLLGKTFFNSVVTRTRGMDRAIVRTRKDHCLCTFYIRIRYQHSSQAPRTNSSNS